MNMIQLEISLLALLAIVAVQVVRSAPLEQVAGQQNQITVKSLGGPSKRVDFIGNETVAEFKRRIAMLDGSQVDTLKLVFAGKQLDDDRLLSDYGIQQDSSVISLQGPKGASNQKSIDTSRPIDFLFIKTITGDTIKVSVDRDLTVGQLKAMIELYKENAAPEKQQLIYNGIVLDDHRTLGESNLTDRATIMLTISMASGRARSTYVKKRLISSVVANINNNIGKFLILHFKHNVQYSKLQIVEATIELHIAKKLPDDVQMREIFSEVLNSNDLLVEFCYEYRGRRDFIRANLRSGAQWIVNQAQEAIDTEQFERDLALRKQKESKKSQN